MKEIYKKKDRVVSSWSGGETSQVFIYPENGDYSSREFKARISIATTLKEKSNFTKLEGVDRVLSILEGNVEISHKDRYNVKLSPYKIEHFKGEWETTAKGRFVDFNLMLQGVEGDFYYLELRKKEEINFEKKEIFIFIYCIDGKVRMNDKILEKEDFFITETTSVAVFSENAKIFYGYIEK